MKIFLTLGAAVFLTIIVWLLINARWVGKQVLRGVWTGRYSDGRNVTIEFDDCEKPNKAGVFRRSITHEDTVRCESGTWTRKMCELKLRVDQRDRKKTDSEEVLYLFWESPDCLSVMDAKEQRTHLERASEKTQREFAQLMQTHGSKDQGNGVA